MIGWLIGLFTKNTLGKIFSTIDNATNNETEREKARLLALEAFVKTQQETWRGPGFWLAFLFVAPLAFWWSAVCVYSVLWCKLCAFPQDFSIAALPSPLDQWAGWIMSSIFVAGGMVGAAKVLRR
jgi:hypothetical protein